MVQVRASPKLQVLWGVFGLQWSVYIKEETVVKAKEVNGGFDDVRIHSHVVVYGTE